ncbi:MAG: response regulator transcription factor [Paludibacteraceae bacterium]
MSTFDNSIQKLPLEGGGGQKVLLIDDDTDLGGFINIALTSLGYEVHFQNSPAGIKGIIKEFHPNVIVLDVEIGKQNGIEEAENILKFYPNIPVIFISSHTQIENINKGLSVGGVCFLKKPFEIQELEAYIRRFSYNDVQENVIPIGMYSLELINQTLVYKEEIIKHLSPLEKNGLLLLIKNVNRVVMRKEFSKELWGDDFCSANEAALNNLISKLREMFKRDTRISIKTVKFQGYKLEFKE